MTGTPFQYAKKLSFPRHVGSEGEQKAASFIINFMKEAGYEIKEEYFHIYFTPWSVLKIGISFGLVLLTFSRIFYRTHPFVSVIFSLAFVAGMMLSDRIWYILLEKKPFKGLLKPATSKNIIARPENEPAYKNRLNLFLIAHYDSKSQNLSLPMRILFLIVLILSCLLLSYQYMTYAINLKHSPFSINLFFSIAAISSIFFLFLKTENKSSGALDNGGSLGVLLSLAEEIKEDVLKNLKITFLFTGAEELGLLGAYAFFQNHEKELKGKESLLLNLDGVGLKGGVRVVSGSGILSAGSKGKLYFYIKRTSQKIGIKTSSFDILPGLMMDHIPFINHGLDTVSLCSVAKESLVIHTKNDSIKFLDEKSLEEVLSLIKALIKELDKEKDSRGY